MVDELRIKVSAESADKTITALKAKLKALIAKKYKIHFVIDTKKAEIDKNLKNIKDKAIKSNKDAKTAITKENDTFIAKEKADFKAWEKRQRLRNSLEKMRADRIHKERKNLERIAKLGELHDPTSDTFQKKSWNEVQMRQQSKGRQPFQKDDRIRQMPQNPLLGRMAQFGMMASGMAATMFLMQMITAQMRMLMTVLTDWEDAISKIIDSTSLTSGNMDGLAEVISEYARNLGIASTAMAEATGAAFKFGIDPTQDNVQKLYALQFSDNVKDYKEAASIMNMAGTEFGDKAAAAYIKKWDAYAGTGETSGTFGYEWDRLKESGKDAMKSIWDADYGAKITDSLRSMSDWVTNNRELIGSVFDKIVTGLSIAWKMLKVITPAAAGFLTLFVATSGLQLFVWLLTSMSKMLGPFSFGFAKSTTEIAKMTAGMSGAAKVGATLRATLVSITPVFIAMAAAWAAWEVGKKAVDLYKIYKISKDMKELTTVDYIGMSSEERSTKETDFLKAEKRRNDLIKEAQRNLKIYESTIKSAGKDAVFDDQFLKEMEAIKKTISILKNQSKEYKDAAKKVTEAESISLARALQAINAESVQTTVAWKTKISLLEKVNKELGYMPKLLAELRESERKTSAPINVAAMGLGEEALISAKENFQDKLKTDPEFKQIRDLITSARKRDDPSLNAAQLKKIDWELIEGMMNEELTKMDLTEKKRAALTAGLKELSKVYHNIKIAGVTLETDKYKDAMKALNEEIDHFNESTYQKKIREVDEQFKGDEGMKALLQERLYLEEKRKIERLQGRRPDDDQRKADLEEAFKFDPKMSMIATRNLKLVGELGSAERALSKERERGLGVISDRELKLKLEVDLLKNAIRYNLNPISDAALKRIRDSITALSEYDTIIKNLGREITIGRLQTEVDNGRISELQKEATIQDRIMKIAKSIEDQGAAAGSEDEKKALKEKQSSLIIYQENIRQLESFQNQASVAGMEQQYQIKKQMSDNYYEYQQRQIALNYLKNEHDVDPHYAKMVKKEEEYQLALKNRRAATDEEAFMIAKTEALRTLSDDYKTFGEVIEDSMVYSFNSLSEAITDSIMTAKSFKEAFDDMAKSVINHLIEMTIKQSLYELTIGSGGSSGGITGLLGKAASLLGFGGTSAISGSVIDTGYIGWAKGGVLSGISAYSNSIVSTPTYVQHATAQKYASGGALFGEAGPEAILPLTRTSSGELGVQADGAGSGPATTNIYINAIDTQTFNDYVRRNPDGIIMAVDDNIVGGGQLRSTIGETL